MDLFFHTFCLILTLAGSDSVTSFCLFASVSPSPFAPHLPPAFSSTSDRSVIKCALFSTKDLCTCCSFSLGQLCFKTLDIYLHLIIGISIT